MADDGTRLIKPLNMSDSVYNTVYRGLFSRKVDISVNILTTDGATYHDLARINRRHRQAVEMQTFDVKVDPLGIFHDLPCRIGEVIFCSHPLIITSDVEELLTTEQRLWLYKGCYCVVSFHQPVSSGIEHIHDGNGFGMVILDRMACLSRSLEPVDHLPFAVDRYLAGRYEEAVCDHYATGVSVHHEKLMKLRNELSIVVRAIAAEENAFRKLEEFRNSKTGYFLW